MTQEQKRTLMVAVLSLSLLTVMAGAAVAPALDVIREHFSDEPVALVQMVISMPALFIALTSPLFGRLAAKVTAKRLAVGALAVYVAAGAGAGLVDSLWAVLAFRALLGMSVGIIMPLSTGLLASYFPPEMQSRLMGYSSAMNQMGGVVGTLAAGLLATISWRTAFLVYLMGLLCVVLCAAFIPDEMIRSRDSASPAPSDAASVASADPSVDQGAGWKPGRDEILLVAAMFFLMLTFFVFPSSFALESAKEGVLSPLAVTLIMTGLDVVAFFGGLAFAGLRKRMGASTRFLAPLLFLAGYACLAFWGGAEGAILGGILIGFANGAGVPFLMSSASMKWGPVAATTILPLLSMALYLAQFVTPAILGVVEALLPGVVHVPYLAALAAAAALMAIQAFIREPSAAASARSALSAAQQE